MPRFERSERNGGSESEKNTVKMVERWREAGDCGNRERGEKVNQQNLLFLSFPVQKFLSDGLSTPFCDGTSPW